MPEQLPVTVVGKLLKRVCVQIFCKFMDAKPNESEAILAIFNLSADEPYIEKEARHA